MIVTDRYTISAVYMKNPPVKLKVSTYYMYSIGMWQKQSIVATLKHETRLQISKELGVGY